MAGILVINGPNLGMLGRRQPELYGATTLEALIAGLRAAFPGTDIAHTQSDMEGDLVRALLEADGHQDGIVLNAGGYSHTSVAVRDAIAAIQVPVIEVHLTNLLSREDFRHRSIIGPVCLGSIMGLGIDGYRLAIEHLLGRAG
ncbi:MAG: 3-dehydroquinate dehydratase [Flavobacteriales bacterium]|nr:3-dehydroquinate dehydratase [Flavobacteriales bacterium]MCB9193819.1 3-dehydroquinate dehydratase [Flavobacteriales bacterium]